MKEMEFCLLGADPQRSDRIHLLVDPVRLSMLLKLSEAHARGPVLLQHPSLPVSVFDYHGYPEDGVSDHPQELAVVR